MTEPLVGRTLKGQTKAIRVEEDAITIVPRALYHGFIGEKRIPYSSITAIQFKEAGGWLAGFIQFSIQGGIEWRGQVNQDENAMQFDKEFNDEFHALRDFVQTRMASASTGTGGSIADELLKLASLRDQGILSEEEFAAQKTKLLG
jgi:hypothetical protein